jgi:uroporphyrinogen-III synthase
LLERMRLDASDGDTTAQSAVKAAESVARGAPPASALADTGPDADAPEADFDDDGQADELPETDALESDE